MNACLTPVILELWVSPEAMLERGRYESLPDRFAARTR